MSSLNRASAEVDAVIVGAGLAGLYVLHKLRGLGLRARVFEGGCPSETSRLSFR